MCSRICFPFMPSESLICLSLHHSLLPPVLPLRIQYSVGVRGKWASLVASCIAGEARCSLTCSLPMHHPSPPPMGGVTAEKGSPGPRLCCLRKGCVGKVRLFHLPSPMCPDMDFFFPLQGCARTSLLKTWTSMSTLSSVDGMGSSLSKTVFPRGSQSMAESSWSWFMGHFRSKICKPITPCTEWEAGQDFSWVSRHAMWNPTAPTKALLSVGECHIVFEGGSMSRGCLIWPSC